MKRKNMLERKAIPILLSSGSFVVGQCSIPPGELRTFLEKIIKLPFDFSQNMDSNIIVLRFTL